MTAITSVHARQILDCRGYPTVQAEVRAGEAVGIADAPAGRSTGSGEAQELRDRERAAYRGFGVASAVAAVTQHIAPALIGRDVSDQAAVDALLCDLDGTPHKSRLGGNAVVAVSLAAARCAAQLAGTPLYRHLQPHACVLPVPMVNLINGGRLTSNDLDFQEFIMMPVGARSFGHAMQMASECHMALFEIVVARYGKLSGNTGDEGGFATPITDVHEALQVLHDGVAAAGYAGDVVYALDCAATHLYDATTRTYTVGGRAYDTQGMIDLYRELIRDFGVASIEDPLHEEDWEGYRALMQAVDVQIVGDDLFVTDAARVRRGAGLEAANALLWKVNQVGTLTEAFAAAQAAYDAGMGVCVSERSGETEDPMIADLTVALGCGQIKTGSPVRGERTSKYNRLLLIEEQLGDRAVFPGHDFRAPAQRRRAPGQ